jgi:hypothetical protein
MGLTAAADAAAHSLELTDRMQKFLLSVGNCSARTKHRHTLCPVCDANYGEVAVQGTQLHAHVALPARVAWVEESWCWKESGSRP